MQLKESETDFQMQKVAHLSSCFETVEDYKEKTWNPPLPPLQEDGGSWGTLNFHLTLGGLSQEGV